MMKRRLGLSSMTLAIAVGTVGLLMVACSKSKDGGGDDDGGGASGGKSSTSSAGAAGSSGAASSSSSKGGGSAKGGADAGSDPPTTGTVKACTGIVKEEGSVGLDGEACMGTAVESEAVPADMILLMDRSISNSYAVGTKSGAAADENSRWAVLTSAMQALASTDDVQDIKASVTFFSYDGSADAGPNCNSKNYEKPAVALAPLETSGPKIIAAMKQLEPSGKTPIIPALEGTYVYARAQKKADPSREKVVVLISDGYPTLCQVDGQPPTAPDVSAAIDAAASAEPPIRTFIIGVGDPDFSSSAARFNLINYATAGQTRTPYMLDETQGAEAVADEMTTALLNITQDPVACEYLVDPPAGMTVDTDQVALTYTPFKGDYQEIPRLNGPDDCGTATNGGWYFDSLTKPTKVIVCPCTCANLAAGKVELIYGCEPQWDLG